MEIFWVGFFSGTIIIIYVSVLKFGVDFLVSKFNKLIGREDVEEFNIQQYLDSLPGQTNLENLFYSISCYTSSKSD
jgi:hypothetical protein